MGKSDDELKRTRTIVRHLCILLDYDSLTPDLIAMNGIVSRALRKPG